MAEVTKLKPKEKKYYVSNVDLFKAYCEWYDDISTAEAAGKPTPQIPNYIAESIVKICTRLSYRPNFINYSFREDMVADGVENVIRTIRNFNPAKSTNPFSFITTVCFNAFIRRIQVEQKQTVIKARIISDMCVEDMIEMCGEDDESGQLQNSLIEFLKEHSYIAGTETSAEKKRKKKNILHEEENTLEVFLEDVDEAEE